MMRREEEGDVDVPHQLICRFLDHLLINALLSKISSSLCYL